MHHKFRGSSTLAKKVKGDIMKRSDSQTEYIGWRSFENAVVKLYEMIPEGEFKNIYGIPRGGLPIAVRLSHLMDLPLIIDDMEVTTDTLVVDDVADTGKTLNEFQNNRIATIFYKPWSERKPDWYVAETKKWVIYPWEVKL